ncbi:MAG: DUF1127 domain-containing protein [Enhydrobacter sp.]|nr:MAG: DUF1127 domain-containing protein [Enhydrobacter sp.]
MMTQPIRMFENLTSETAPAGENASKFILTPEQRHYIELRARHERAEVLSNLLGDALLWLGHQVRRLVVAVKGDYKLRLAEAQLHRMSDRELADLGLTRADITFAVRDATGEAPQFDVTGMPAAPANGNLRRAA